MQFKIALFPSEGKALEGKFKRLKDWVFEHLSIQN
jgi:hypothetical protein